MVLASFRKREVNSFEKETCIKKKVHICFSTDSLKVWEQIHPTPPAQCFLFSPAQQWELSDCEEDAFLYSLPHPPGDFPRTEDLHLTSTFLKQQPVPGGYWSPWSSTGYPYLSKGALSAASFCSLPFSQASPGSAALSARWRKKLFPPATKQPQASLPLPSPPGYVLQANTPYCRSFIF